MAGSALWAWSRVLPDQPTRNQLSQTVWGLHFPNPVGLAAGMDKGQVLVPAWFRIGFGFVEIGTVTPRPQRGNPRPRLFRLVEHHAIVNRMGFNNPGAERVARRLARLRARPGPIGVNIGRNKDTPNDRAADDYVAAFRALAEYGDYAAINVSSPNTPGLRSLQEEGELRALIAAVARTRDELRHESARRVPLLVKVSPDEPPERLDAVADAVAAAGAESSRPTRRWRAREWRSIPARSKQAGCPVRRFAEPRSAPVPACICGWVDDCRSSASVGSAAPRTHTGGSGRVRRSCKSTRLSSTKVPAPFAKSRTDSRACSSETGSRSAKPLASMRRST